METVKRKPANAGFCGKKEKVFLTHFLAGAAKEGFTEERDPKLRSEGISKWRLQGRAIGRGSDMQHCGSKR